LIELLGRDSSRPLFELKTPHDESHAAFLLMESSVVLAAAIGLSRELLLTWLTVVIAVHLVSLQLRW
jgi:hypothetical protein